MGVFFDRECDPELYQEASKEADRIIRMSGGSTGYQESSVAAVSPKVEEAERLCQAHHR